MPRESVSPHVEKRIAAHEPRDPMAVSFEQPRIDVWRQVLVRKVKVVLLGGEH
jgi:hypothetical protein